MSLPRYPAYKDSGVPWLGEVPAHWGVKRLKHGARLVTEKATSVDHPVALENIESRTGRLVPTETEFESVGIAFEPGDILFGKLRPYLAKVWLADRSGEAVGDFLVVRPEPRLFHGPYLRSQILSEAFIDVVNGASFGSKMPRADWEQVGGMGVCQPPLAEQEAIAAFLDRETARVDALVAEQGRLIALLKEKRQAVISHAVTRGLNPDAPRKPSGVAWLGDVPAHWEVKPLKRVSPQLTVGIVVEPSRYYAAEGIPALRSLNVGRGRILTDNMVFITPAGHAAHSKSRLSAGDLVAVRSGQPGTTAVVPAELDGCNCIDLIVIRRPGVGSEHFLSWCLASDMALHQFSMGTDGAIQQHFNVTTAESLLVTQPPPLEQQAIADFLDRETAAIDALIAEAERAITLLGERRAALIAAAVTGRVDVRGVAAGEGV